MDVSQFNDLNATINNFVSLVHINIDCDRGYKNWNELINNYDNYDKMDG